MREGLSEAELRLRPPSADDFCALASLRRDEQVQSTLMSHPEVRVGDDTADWVARKARDPHGEFLVVDAGGVCQGFVQLTDIHGIDRHARFGIALIGSARGRGVGRRAMAALIAHARALGLRKLLCDVRDDNAAAAALYRAIGFRSVGTMRAHYDDGRRRWDVHLMEALLDENVA